MVDTTPAATIALLHRTDRGSSGPQPENKMAPAQYVLTSRALLQHAGFRA